MKPEVASHRIESFGQRFGEAHLYLAYHAAFPLALTPDLLYRLWANFQRDIDGEVLSIPWMAVADLLLSSLCDEVGHELYEMNTAVRNALLKQLKADPRFGEKRINELSDFLLTYVRQQLESHDPDMRDFAQAQRWTALAYTRPSQAAHELALTLSQLKLEEKAEWVRMASLMETFTEPLAEFKPLLIYARGMANFVRSKQEPATAEMISLLANPEPQLRIAGVNLPIPEQITSSVDEFSSIAQSPTSLNSSQSSTTVARILVVDYKPATIVALQAILERWNYQVDTATSSMTVVSTIETSPPDLILLAVRMPEMDGYELTHHIRNNSNLSYIPILLITAFPDRSSIIKGFDAGADDVIGLPLDMNELLARVRSLLRLKSEINKRDQILIYRDGSFQENEIFSDTEKIKSIQIRSKVTNPTPQQKENLASAAAEIQQLIQNIEQTYPSTTNTEKMVVAAKAVEEIEKNKTLKDRILGALKAGATQALEEMIVAQPVVKIVLAAFEGWQKTE
ncbi:PleD family two-component system response regulator [Dendronalium sp. ChiSLP03b]|uniref:response regulator n=1 Tax=Dendronalium sp. ChiSLP03b TaxID=3075381 RepID=UPI002AD50819|nr:response regulator [Dendronalium sp. ChiSLP03b]MDZ8207638.1 response regulator [Dendronalium sp. ChiSLP03b]